MKHLILICIAWLTPVVSLGQEAASAAPEEAAHPSASVALLLALDSVLNTAHEPHLEILGAKSEIIEATESKAAYAAVEIDLLVRTRGSAKAESDFRMLEEAVAKRGREPHTGAATYQLFVRTLIQLAAEEDARSIAAADGATDESAGSEMVAGTHRGIVRTEFALAAIPSYRSRGPKAGRSGPPLRSSARLEPYILGTTRSINVQFGEVAVELKDTPVPGGIRRDAAVTRTNPTDVTQPAGPVDFRRISNLMYLLEAKSSRATVTSIEMGAFMKGSAETFEFHLSVYE